MILSRKEHINDWRFASRIDHCLILQLHLTLTKPWDCCPLSHLRVISLFFS